MAAQTITKSVETLLEAIGSLTRHSKASSKPNVVREVLEKAVECEKNLTESSLKSLVLAVTEHVERQTQINFEEEPAEAFSHLNVETVELVDGPKLRRTTSLPDIPCGSVPITQRRYSAGVVADVSTVGSGVMVTVQQTWGANLGRKEMLAYVALQNLKHQRREKWMEGKLREELIARRTAENRVRSMAKKMSRANVSFGSIQCATSDDPLWKSDSEIKASGVKKSEGDS